MSGLTLQTRLSNLKSVALSILELLADLTPKNLGSHMTLATPTFRKFLRGHVHTVPGNMRIKFEVRSFNAPHS